MMRTGGKALIVNLVHDVEGTDGQAEDSAFNSVVTFSSSLEQELMVMLDNS
jgi:hypothetical protein